MTHVFAVCSHVIVMNPDATGSVFHLTDQLFVDTLNHNMIKLIIADYFTEPPSAK